MQANVTRQPLGRAAPGHRPDNELALVVRGALLLAIGVGIVLLNSLALLPSARAESQVSASTLAGTAAHAPGDVVGIFQDVSNWWDDNVGRGGYAVSAWVASQAGQAASRTGPQQREIANWWQVRSTDVQHWFASWWRPEWSDLRGTLVALDQGIQRAAFNGAHTLLQPVVDFVVWFFNVLFGIFHVQPR